jgi:hypothetical protein
MRIEDGNRFVWKRGNLVRSQVDGLPIKPAERQLRGRFRRLVMIHPLGEQRWIPADADQEKENGCTSVGATLEFIRHGDILAWTTTKATVMIGLIR